MTGALVKLRELRDSMRGAQRQVADYLLEHPEDVLEMSIHKLAEKTFSSPSTIVRMCARAGFSGYREFRRNLAWELALRQQVRADAPKDISHLDSLSDIVEKITYKNIMSLEETRDLVDEEALRQCVELLNSCRIVLLFGIGASLLVAQDAYLKFLRVNKLCIFNSDWHSQLLMARNATAEDCAIVFSYSGETEEVINCMKELRENHTPIIAITRYSPSPVAGLADYKLYTAATETIFRSGAMASRISQLNIIDILYTAFADIDYENNLRQFTRTHIYKAGSQVKPESERQPQTRENVLRRGCRK